MVLEEKQVPHGWHCPHNRLDDVLDDIVGIVRDLILSRATVHHTALVLGAHFDVRLQERLHDDASVRGCAHQHHHILCVVDFETRLAIVAAGEDLLAGLILVDLGLGYGKRIILVVVERGQVAGVVRRLAR